MEILEPSRYGEYEAFVSAHKNGGFTQSVHWPEVKAGWGRRVVVSRDAAGEIVGGMLILTKKVPGLNRHFLYAPRGPVFDYGDEAVFADLVEGVKAVAKLEHGFAFKMDPMVMTGDTAFVEMARKYGFTYQENQTDDDTIQRRSNYMLPLAGRTKEELLASFHQKWRYNIRLAGRKGVVCKVGTKEDLPDFMKVYQVTGQRDGFNTRPMSYFERMLDALGEQVRLYLCYYEGRPISGAITTNYAGKTCYVYGASDNAFRNVMPNHLMQWEMIQWAVDTGCVVYDFQGIPLDLSGNDHMHGVYLFKKGFNGQVVTFAGEFDLVFTPWVEKFVDFSEKVQARMRKRRARKKAKAAKAAH
ncbi:lipid II:glycine glycyltransferase FemX [Bittarella massiliensis (ex Durand et al. 2017)]|uniref:lipid II:glycine glycyltransferase FemX n=1 Tax=Bittarella massiliensis (ex Durand et al. 2017) TaxID=1720313 RepID=UPI001AA1331C|nr:peptidoglycan bridge formation glycyltransferase FemA/FemB family protein [Bittarella massiliensis (ex Durand et al. 2017)]MBO1678390.1 peptidoglycan bridge formation glycyltransferase FemA/FemB family protein [Bittarella massiliensis (ex Durand et al. 2017)]